MQLSPVQVRVLGCLLEKERATPDNYPLTMNGLLSACNQTTNRWPVVALSEATVANAIENLKAYGLLRVVYSRSNRADKYRHVLDEAWSLADPELAVLAVLLLRGGQTAAELRTRAERLHPFAEVDEVEAVLAALAAREEPLVARLGRAPGQKEARWGHLVGGEPAPDDGPPPAADHARVTRGDRIEALESALADVRAEVQRLRADHDVLAARLAEVLD
ncbi:MAG: DUF480 domain-containing protein [Acidimicrobiales bacterium]